MWASLFVPIFSVAALSSDDLKRARTKVPRSGFLGGNLVTANAKLNRHLYGMDGLELRECEKWSVEELRELLRSLQFHSSEELKELYSHVDGRHTVYKSIEDMNQHWLELSSTDDIRIRDGHCHEAVMVFVHHLSEESRHVVKQQTTIPKLPMADHTETPDDVAGAFYKSKVTCQMCHVGGLVNPFDIDMGKPEEGSLDKSRRCYTNYKELYGITCEPCDGIAGPYWGDDTSKFYEPPTCIEVGKPDDIPEAERAPIQVPNQFSVEIVGGSDRWGRTENPQLPDIAPFPPRMNSMYGQISGHWYMNAKPEDDMWYLRHDTHYANLSWNGSWDENQTHFYNLTQFHVQSRQQAMMNVTGPMVSLNRSNTWVDGESDAFCVCIPDPVGVPDVSASRAPGLDHLEYLGRIKLAPIEYLGRTVELDHYATWFFHIFMETNKSSPYYGKAPIRLASAYAGTAVYANWVFEDPNVTHPGIWTEDIPTHENGELGYCLNPTGNDLCNSVKTFDDDKGPATWPPKSSGFGDKCSDHPGCAHLMPLDGLCCPVADGTRLACCDAVEPSNAFCLDNPSCSNLSLTDFKPCADGSCEKQVLLV